MSMIRLLLVLLSASVAYSQDINDEQTGSSPFFFNGNIGFSFGDIQTISLSPGLGYKITPHLGIGAGLTYIDSKDKRYDPVVSETIIGPKAFAIYSISSQIYAKTQYEHLKYETSQGGIVQEDTKPIWYAGGGYRIGSGGLGFSVEFLYDLLHDPDTSLSKEPYTIQGGVNIGI